MGGHVAEIRAQITVPRVPVPWVVFFVRMSAPNRCGILCEAQNLYSCSADCLLGQRSRLVLLCLRTLSVAGEMKRLQKLVFPTGVPNMRMPSVISCGMPSLVEFFRIM